MEADSPSIILVVDDDAGLLRLIQKALRRAGYTAATAASGKDAVEWLTRNRADLMLLDLKLQDIEGKELVNRLAGVQRTVPFIIITGQGDERVAVDMMKRGALDYLIKDANFLEFIPEVVRHSLAQLARDKRLAEADEALCRSETVLARAEEIAHVGAYEINVGGAGGDHWSLETFRILGLDPAMKELTPGEYVSRCIHPEDRARVREIFDKSLDQRVRFDLEYRIVRPDGSVRHVHHIVEPVAGAAEKVVKLTGTLQDITQRKELEREILEISEREQRRIGQDLHDGLGQRLTAIELMCESLRSDLALAQPESEKQAAQLCRYLRETIAQTRSLARGLAPFKVESGGLEGALTELAQTTALLSRVECRFYCPSPVLLEDSKAAAHLYRIAQEAVNNAVKHGQPGEVVIHLSRRNGTISLRVTDNGKGLPRKRTQDEGMGLHVMKHRAGTIGARLEVTSKRGKGVTVTCTLARNKG